MSGASGPRVIVVGLGAMGAAASYQLAQMGAQVIGLDRYTPPHPFGSTHGETRITRLAIGEGPEYVPLVQRSHQLWREIEAQAATDIFNQCGGLILGDKNNAFLASTRASAASYGIAHEDLTASQIRSRFPTFAVSNEIEGYYEPEAGYLRPEAAVQAQLDLATKHGTDLRYGQVVESWRTSGDGIEVRLDQGEWLRGDRLLICAGPWLPQLCPELAEHFAVQRQLLYWFPMRDNFEAFAAAPVFIWEIDGPRTEFSHSLGFYGFPAVDGPRGGVKLATEQASQTTTPDGHKHPATAAEIAEMGERYVRPCLPNLGLEPLRTVSCLYTSTRGSRFLIDRHPSCEQALIVSPCSGHGFKHSAAIGEAIAQWALTGESQIDLEPFALTS